MEFSCESRWNARQYVRFRHAVRQHAPSWRRTRLITGVVLLVLASEVATAGPTRPLAMALGVACILLILSLLAMLVWGVPWYVARRLQKSEPSVHAPIVRRLGPDGLKIIGSQRTHSLSWDQMLRVVETREFFLFFHTREEAYFLPKDPFGESTLAKLRGLIHAEAGSRAEIWRTSDDVAGVAAALG